MKRFKQYLSEDFLAESFLLEETGEWQQGIHWKEHHFQVGPHKVQVNYDTTSANPHHWEVNYKVNDAYDKANQWRGEVNTHQQEILHHVAKSIHGFIQSQKPKSLSMAPNSAAKTPLYSKFADHLAKHYGAKVETIGDRHKVDFSGSGNS